MIYAILFSVFSFAQQAQPISAYLNPDLSLSAPINGVWVRYLPESMCLGQPPILPNPVCEVRLKPGTGFRTIEGIYVNGTLIPKNNDNSGDYLKRVVRSEICRPPEGGFDCVVRKIWYSGLGSYSYEFSIEGVHIQYKSSCYIDAQGNQNGECGSPSAYDQILATEDVFLKAKVCQKIRVVEVNP